MKFKVGLCSIIIFLFFISCDSNIINGNNGDVELVRIFDVEIPERINLGQAINFKMHCETPTPGWKFHHTEISKTAFDFDIYVKVYAERPSGIWVQVLGSFTTSDQFAPAFPGNYTFHFYQRYPSEYLIKVVTVQ